VLDNLDFPGAG